jgi:hypothetical protein
MGRGDEPSGVASILGPPAIVAIAALLLALMPNEMRFVLTIWTLASFPIGALVGHCMLNDDRPQRRATVLSTRHRN